MITPGISENKDQKAKKKNAQFPFPKMTFILDILQYRKSLREFERNLTRLTSHPSCVVCLACSFDLVALLCFFLFLHNLKQKESRNNLWLPRYRNVVLTTYSSSVVTSNAIRNVWAPRENFAPPLVWSLDDWIVIPFLIFINTSITSLCAFIISK